MHRQDGAEIKASHARCMGASAVGGTTGGAWPGKVGILPYECRSGLPHCLHGDAMGRRALMRDCEGAYKRFFSLHGAMSRGAYVMR